MKAILRATGPRASRIAHPTLPCRALHSTARYAANVSAQVGTGPPPSAPAPAIGNYNERVERRRKQKRLMESAKQIRNQQNNKSVPVKRRFWKDVSVKEVDGEFQIFLDSRALRNPQNKEIIRLPVSKPNLASALALEWDLLTSVQQASKQHLIPLTSLICRALDIVADDASGSSKIRENIVNMVLNYLDTDSVLCFAPPAGKFDPRNDKGEDLHEVQRQSAEEIIAHMTTHVWPGATLVPALDGDGIFPREQPEGVRDIIRAWAAGLSAWELTGLERATLAGKSFLGAARLIAEWSEDQGGIGPKASGPRFGVEEAAKATNMEIDWQSRHWGEVDDTHDVNREDMRRHFGTVMLLVSGTKKL